MSPMMPDDLRKVAPISVVIPCYRCGATIDRAVASVLAQSLPVAEIILVDDASGDDTLEILTGIRERCGSELIRIVEASTNCGPGEARKSRDSVSMVIGPSGCSSVRTPDDCCPIH